MQLHIALKEMDNFIGFDKILPDKNSWAKRIWMLVVSGRSRACLSNTTPAPTEEASLQGWHIEMGLLIFLLEASLHSS